MESSFAVQARFTRRRITSLGVRPWTFWGRGFIEKKDLLKRRSGNDEMSVSAFQPIAHRRERWSRAVSSGWVSVSWVQIFDGFAAKTWTKRQGCHWSSSRLEHLQKG